MELIKEDLESSVLRRKEKLSLVKRTQIAHSNHSETWFSILNTDEVVGAGGGGGSGQPWYWQDYWGCALWGGGTSHFQNYWVGGRGGGSLTFGLLAKITNIIYYLLNLLFTQSCLYSGLGLDDLSLAWPAVVQLMVSFNSDSQWILPRVLFFVLSWWSVWFLCRRYGALIELGSHYALFMYFVLWITSGPWVKFFDS